MKTFFKIAAVAVAALCSMNVFAQNRTYLSAGYDRVSFSVKESGVSASLNSDLGFHAGLGMEFGVASNLYVDAECRYIYAKFEESDVNIKAHTINLPLRLKFKTGLSETVDLSLFAGPMLSYGISCKAKLGGYSEDLYDSDLERFDVKAGIGCGLEFSKKFGINVGYDWGLLDQSDDCKINVLQVGVSFFFN